MLRSPSDEGGWCVTKDQDIKPLLGDTTINNLVDVSNLSHTYSSCCRSLEPLAQPDDMGEGAAVIECGFVEFVK